MHEAKFAVPKISLTISCCVLLYFVISQEASSQNSTNRSKKSIELLKFIQFKPLVMFNGSSRSQKYMQMKEKEMLRTIPTYEIAINVKELLGLGLR